MDSQHGIKDSGSDTVEPFVRLDEDDDRLSMFSIATLSTMPGGVGGRMSPSRTPEENAWITKSRILHGIPLQGLLSGNRPFLPFSHRTVAVPLVPISIEKALTTDVAIWSTTSTAETALMRLGFVKSAAEVTLPWTTFFGDTARDNDVPAIHVTRKRAYPRVVAQTELEDLAPNPEFVADVEKVLAIPDQDAQVKALQSVLRRWGSVIATHVEIGCGMVSSVTFRTPAELPNFGRASNPHDRRAQLAAENVVHNAHRFRATKKASGATQEEKQRYEDLSRELSFKVIGGTAKMQIDRNPDAESLTNSELWTIIGVDGVYSTLDLLQANHTEVYEKVQQVLTAVQANVVKTPDSPIVTFPGRLMSSKYGNGDHHHMNGYLDVPIPEFDPSADFTLSAWIKSGNQGTTAIALSIECAELSESLLAIGEWNKDGVLQAVRARPHGSKFALTHAWLKGTAHGRLRVNQWQHIAFLQSQENLSFFIDGKLTMSTAAAKVPHASVSQIKLCIGRGGWQNKPCDQWDGEIQGVKLRTRVLSFEEVVSEGDAANCPDY